LRVARFVAVMDDWPEVVPIADAELRIMERHFAAELDEIFGPRACGAANLSPDEQ
jgi:hypothetical protein